MTVRNQLGECTNGTKLDPTGLYIYTLKLKVNNAFSIQIGVSKIEITLNGGL